MERSTVTDTQSIALSLISHTNAGKTTLARTLLDRDVGDVRDAPHVTQEASVHRLIESTAGDVLSLWDTPGFGDSARLAKRLAQEGSPVGWFLTQVWDRYRDRSFWLTQKAVRNVRDDADLVLYLVNASEPPEDAGYLAAELAILAWTGKPVIALLNQTGAVADPAVEARWRERLVTAPVREALPLDAFARCWVQERVLFDAIARALPATRHAAFARLANAWEARRQTQFEKAMAAIAAPVANAALDRAATPNEKLLTRVGRQLGIGGAEAEGATQRSEREMAQRVERELRACTDRLIEIHELKGNAAAEVRAYAAAHLRRDAPVDEGKAAMVGGIVSGALTGLGADLAAGGLTLGGGMLAGAILGAIGGAGVARGMNVARDRTQLVLSWSDAFLAALVGDVLLRYLEVAHFGRGRGEWRSGTVPALWREQVDVAIGNRREELAAIWTLRAADAAAVEPRLRECLAACALAVLEALYPEASRSRPP